MPRKVDTKKAAARLTDVREAIKGLGESFQFGALAKALPHIPPSSIRVVLRSERSAGKLFMKGDKRAARYSLFDK